MRARVIAIEKFPTEQANMKEARAGETCGLLLEFISTTEDATQTDLVDEQHDDGRVEAVRNDPPLGGDKC